LTLAVGTSTAPLRAQQQGRRKDARPAPEQQFTGSMFGSDSKPKDETTPSEVSELNGRRGAATPKSSDEESKSAAAEAKKKEEARAAALAWKLEQAKPVSRPASKSEPKSNSDSKSESNSNSARRPVPYMTVTSRVVGVGAQQTTSPAPAQTTQQPAPSANNPPAQTGAPSQGPQTASPTQSQTQQSTNPAAPAQSQQQPAQPAVPPTAPPTSTTDTQLPAPQAPTGRPTQTQTQPGAPGGQVQSPAGPTAPGRESVPTAAPADTTLNVPQVAPGFEARQGPFPTLERVGVDMGEQRALSVREAIELALSNNKDIEVARENVRAAEFDLRAARGVYDPRFTTNSYYERTETPAASFLSGTSTGSVTQSGVFSNSSVQGLTPKFGGGYRVDFVNNRITTDNIFSALNPQYPTSLTFSYTQPLLRGLRFDQSRRQIEIAKKNLSLTDAQFRQRAIETITGVQRAYWDLVYTLRNLQIQREAVRDARQQLEHNRRMVSEGMLAPIDVVAAEAQVSGFEQSVYSALDDVGRAENNLKNLIAENREAPIWRVSLVPSDNVDVPPPAVALDDAMQVALKSRPELLSSDVAREINEIEQRFAREQTKPQIDLVASYGMVGLAGSTTSQDGTNPLTAQNTLIRERINELAGIVNTLSPGSNIQTIPTPPAQALPPVLVGGEAQSLTNLAANRFTNFRAGVTINLPFRNTTAKAQLGRTLVDAERIRTQREQLEQLIQVDVRNALQLVRTAESRLRAAASARSASEQQYASEQRKLDAGQSTVFLVLERQTQLTTARGNELRAQTELNKAIADLQRATGNALEQNRVEIQLK
ncbi:MAG TPA: TolC family protein, partial [Pyrinomonadaceae bacterium]|nr:TolC family protein [Pyrinomonadaceae bacterium]